MAYNGVQIENSPNIIVITDSDVNQITVTQPITRIIEVTALGPQGQVGPQGPSGSFDNISGSFVTTASFAAFTASINAFTASYSTGSFTGSFTGSANLFNFTASDAFVTGNVTVLGTASINTLVVNQTQLSTGSNQLGDAADDTQTLYGTVIIPTGSFIVSGSSYFTGSLNLGTGTVLYGDTANSSLILDQTTGAYLKYGTTSEIGLLGSITRLRAANSIQLQTSTTTHLFVSSSGNVGINTTSSVSKLTVAGGTDTIYNDGTLKVVGDIALNSANNLNPGLNRWALRVRASGSEGAFDIYDARNSVSRLFINDAGNVGIGTTAPTGSLHVRGGLGGATSLATATGNAILRLDYASNPGLGMYFGAINSGGGAFQYIQAGTSTGTIAYNLTLSPYGGNVGVGTTAPTSGRLQIQGSGTTSATIALLVQNANASASLVVLDNGEVYANGPGFFATNTAFGSAALRNTTSGIENAAFGNGTLTSNTVGTRNVAMGDNAMNNNTSGSLNVAIGMSALRNNSIGSSNVAIGFASLNSYTGGNNTAVGYEAARYTATATGITAIGYQALRINSGSENTALGYQAGLAITSGVSNITIGVQSMNAATNASNNISIGQNLRGNLTGNANIAIGRYALDANTASNNVAIGYEAAFSNTTGTEIVAVGYQALRANTAQGNTAVGFQALQSNSVGGFNTAVGRYALQNSTSGSNNVGVGTNALLNNTTGQFNVGIGTGALNNNAASSNNIAIGIQALYSNTVSSNIAIGYEAAYSNFNGSGITAIGHQALKFNSGSSNTAVGYQAAQANTSGTAITAVGYQALYNNSGSYVTAIGNRALANNTSANDNTAVGQAALEATTTGGTNTAVGANSSRGNVTGTNNTSLGSDSLRSNTAANNNVALGASALFSNTASNNVAVGVQAAYNNTTGTGITAIGYQALSNSTGNNNTAVGTTALVSTTTGVSNVGIGTSALSTNTTGVQNVAVGVSALGSSIAAVSNVAVGYTALFNLGIGDQNTALGNAAGRFISGGVTTLTTSSNSVFIGHAAYPLGNNQTNQIVVGANTVGLGSNTAVLGNTSITQTHLFGSITIGSSTFSPLARLHVLGAGSTSATRNFLLQNSTPSTLLTVLDNGQYTYSGPLLTLAASQSAYVISQSISSSNTVGGQVYGVNITPTFWQTTASQTETAFRVAATFTQSSTLATAGTNIIADFGASSVGSQLTVTDVTSGSIYMVNDVSGLPIIEATSDWTVNMYNFPTKVFQKTGSQVIISGSLVMAATSSFVFPLTSSASPLTGSAYWSGSFLFIWDGLRYRSSSFA